MHPLRSVTSVEELLSLPYFDILACITSDSLHPGGGAATQVLLDACSIKHSERVLEIGCGPGWTTRALVRAGLNVTVVEQSLLMAQAMLYHCLQENLAAPKLHITSIESFDTKNRSDRLFDVVILECVVGFINDRRAMEKVVQNCLSSNGRIAVLDVHYKAMPSQTKLDDLADLIGYRFVPLTRLDWLSLFPKLQCKTFKSFVLRPAPDNDVERLLNYPEVATWLSAFPLTDRDKLARFLKTLGQAFQNNKNLMEGHIAVYSK